MPRGLTRILADRRSRPTMSQAAVPPTHPVPPAAAGPPTHPVPPAAAAPPPHPVPPAAAAPPTHFAAPPRAHPEPAHAVDKGVTTESPTSVIGHNVNSPPSPGRGTAPALAPGAAAPQYHGEPPTATTGPVDGKTSLGSSLTSDHTHGSMDRDAALAKVHGDKTMSHIRAWEESEKAKSINRCNAKLAKITAWENTKKAAAEAKLRRSEEKLEKKRAQLVEKMRNQIAAAHKMAEEKRAEAEARKGEEIFKIEENAAKYKAEGHKPGGFLCFKS